MRFFTDQDVYSSTMRHLRELGHDVITASEKQMSRAVDSDLLRTAVLITAFSSRVIAITVDWFSSNHWEPE